MAIEGLFELADENLRPIGLLLLVLAAIAASHISQKYHFFIPESGVTIMVGAGFGFLEMVATQNILPPSNEFATIFLNQVLLPLIIFESGFSLKKTGMKRNFGSIMGFAVIGTIISAFSFAVLIYYLGRYFVPQYPLNAVECLLFGSLISATDAVATLSILCEAFHIRPKVTPPPLYDIIFGESILNDAVAIILFSTFKNFARHPNVDLASDFELIGIFFYIVVGSCIIGAICAMSSALLFKYTKLRERSNFDVCLLYIFALGSYYLASYLDMSGIFSIFFCGVVMGHYTWHNLAIYTQVTASQIFKSLASVAETVIFAFVGRSIFAILPQGVWDAKLFGVSMLVLLVSRMIAVFPTSWGLNLGRSDKITWAMQTAIWFAGLRGGIAFSLALQTTQISGINQPYVIVTSTLFIAIFTTVVFGALTDPFFRLLKVVPEKGAHDVPETPGRPHATKVRSRETFVIMKVPSPKHLAKKHHHHHHHSHHHRSGSVMTPRTAASASLSKKLIAHLKSFDQRFFKPIFRANKGVVHEHEDGNYSSYMSDFARNVRQTPRFMAEEQMQGFGHVLEEEEKKKRQDLEENLNDEQEDENESEESFSESGSESGSGSESEQELDVESGGGAAAVTVSESDESQPLRIAPPEDFVVDDSHHAKSARLGHVAWGATEYKTFSN